MADVRKVLLELRENASLSQAELADRSGVTLASIKNYEQGKRFPTWEAVVKIARALGASLDSVAEAADWYDTDGAEGE